MVVHRRRPKLTATVRAVLTAAAGARPDDPPPLWGLIVSLVQSERLELRAQRSRARAEERARSLPRPVEQR